MIVILEIIIMEKNNKIKRINIHYVPGQHKSYYQFSLNFITVTNYIRPEIAVGEMLQKHMYVYIWSLITLTSRRSNMLRMLLLRNWH